MRILIAEDEKNLNQMLKRRLQEEYYSVDSCFDGQEALDYLSGAEYDAVQSVTPLSWTMPKS